MKRFFAPRLVLAVALAAVFAFAAVPAYATTVPTGTVPSHSLVGAVDLYGMTVDNARAAVATNLPVPTLKSTVVKGAGRTFTFSTAGVVTLNVDSTLLRAYSVVDTVTPFSLKPIYTISWAKVAAWSAKVAKGINNKPVNAKRTVSKKKKLVLHAEKLGHTVNQTKTTIRIRTRLASELASSGLAPKPVWAYVTAKAPKITRKNIGKAIIVVLSKRTLTLYNGAKIEKRYHCAIGQPAYPTPTGVFKIVRKVKLPSWHNPFDAWSKNMPAYIGPGPNNPLGTRAMYLSAPGIRIHGVPVSENASIGRAASHGCLRMHRHDVENLFPRVKVGTPVYIVK